MIPQGSGVPEAIRPLFTDGAGGKEGSQKIFHLQKNTFFREVLKNFELFLILCLLPETAGSCGMEAAVWLG
jgi:hypothetical protein